MNISIHPRAPSTLRKRDGRQARFEPGKILRTIHAAGEATGEFGQEDAVILADLAQARLADRDGLGSEDVQDIVERGLMEAGYYAAARAYIVHHERRRLSAAAMAS